MTTKPGDSSVQQEAERWLISSLSRKLDVQLVKKKWTVGQSHMEVDGYCPDPLILCEAWAHIGKPKPAQKYKIMNDAFKLLFIQRHTRRKHRRILLFACPDAAAPFKDGTWMSESLAAFTFEIEIRRPSPKMRAAILGAQKRQMR